MFQPFFGENPGWAEIRLFLYKKQTFVPSKIFKSTVFLLYTFSYVSYFLTKFQSHDSLPRLHDSLSHLHDSLSHLHDSLPHLHDSLPHLHDSLPHLHDSLPQSHDSLLHSVRENRSMR